MKKYYVNVKDYQCGQWAMGVIRTIKEWKKHGAGSAKRTRSH